MVSRFIANGYTYENKPTEYAGEAFRSRLEAAWAHLFDQAGIAWEYEPVRLAGWVPDFRLQGRWLVEVKPALPTGASMVRDARAAFRKAVRAFPTILLGNGPGGCLGAQVTRSVARSVFYDPSVPSRLRFVDGDGAGDPCSGALTAEWRAARIAVGIPGLPRPKTAVV